jgi:hypothetical protein
MAGEILNKKYSALHHNFNKKRYGRFQEVLAARRFIAIPAL